MPNTFAKTMFSEPARDLQQRNGSRAQYERMARFGTDEQELGIAETEFITARDSFYMATVTPDGWPYVQHRGGPRAFSRFSTNTPWPSPTIPATSSTSVPAILASMTVSPCF